MSVRRIRRAPERGLQLAHGAGARARPRGIDGGQRQRGRLRHSVQTPVDPGAVRRQRGRGPGGQLLDASVGEARDEALLVGDQEHAGQRERRRVRELVLDVDRDRAPVAQVGQPVVARVGGLGGRRQQARPDPAPAEHAVDDAELVGAHPVVGPHVDHARLPGGPVTGEQVAHALGLGRARVDLHLRRLVDGLWRTARRTRPGRRRGRRARARDEDEQEKRSAGRRTWSRMLPGRRRRRYLEAVKCARAPPASALSGSQPRAPVSVRTRAQPRALRSTATGSPTRTLPRSPDGPGAARSSSGRRDGAHRGQGEQAGGVDDRAVRMRSAAERGDPHAPARRTGQDDPRGLLGADRRAGIVGADPPAVRRQQVGEAHPVGAAERDRALLREGHRPAHDRRAGRDR